MTKTTEASLPTEIWIEIFNKIDTFTQMVQCSLVSSRWRHLTEAAMSSRVITIYSEGEALNLLSLLIVYLQTNQLVMHLKMMPQNRPPLKYFREVIQLVITRNMKTFDESLEGALCFKVMLDKALNEEGLADFSNLKVLPSPWEYCTYYDKLLHHLRNNLVELTLNFRHRHYYLRLKHEWTALRHLGEITQLNALTFNSYVHDIKETEAILKNCDSLQRLSIHLPPTHSLFLGEESISRWIKENTQQCGTLKTLKVIIQFMYDSNLIDYFMHKYPNVESIVVEMIDIVEPWRTFYKTPVEMDEIEDVLGKIERVPEYTLVCYVHHEKFDRIITELQANGYSVTSSDVHYTITVTNGRPNRTTAINADTTIHARQQLIPMKI